MSNYQQLVQLLRRANISPEEVDFLTKFFAKAVDNDVASLVKLGEQNLQYIPKVARNIHKKLTVLEMKKIEEWKSLLQQEAKTVSF